jgi:hypothetical protein
METLNEQFDQALTMIGLGPKRARAIEAHEDIRATLEADPELKTRSVDTILIGSYGRETAIYPGRDVDVFVELPDANDEPETLFQLVKAPLVAKYGSRVSEGRRAVKIDFPDEFGVDAVAAEQTAAHWQIPATDAEGARTEWEETDPELLSELTTERNVTPTVGDRGAYVPTVKMIRQVRRHHLGDAKPGGLYFELETYWAFEASLAGTTFAQILAATLDRTATQLESGTVISDPAIDREYRPTPNPADLDTAAALFRDLASKAAQAIAAERCPAAVLWREILGDNERGPVFPLPAGCDEKGDVIKSVTPVADRGSREARPFA